jgi:hypothetical protein
LFTLNDPNRGAFPGERESIRAAISVNGLVSAMRESGSYMESKIFHGRLVARFLSGSWNGSALSLSADELGQISGLITTCGAGGLGWSKLRESRLRDSHIGELFQAQYRFQTLKAGLHELHLKKVIPLLRANGVEPLLVKGWATARLYPEPGMRPYLDLDLCVTPEDSERARGVLKSGECDECLVDLHVGFGKFYDQRTDEIFANSRLVKLDDLDVRVLAPEDDLRFLCLHLLRHGAMQPLWLCDVAVLLEAHGKDLDWDRCLSGARRQADWVACALGIGHQLLGLDLGDSPVGQRASKLPDWLIETVLEEWGTPLKSLQQLVIYLRDPRSWLRGFITEFVRHWPNAIEATMTMEGPFNGLPRLPFQIGHMFSRTLAMPSYLRAGSHSAVLHRG